MSTCRVSAVPPLCASSTKHQTLALGKPVLKARLFRHFPGEGSALRLDRTFPRTVPSLLTKHPIYTEPWLLQTGIAGSF